MPFRTQPVHNQAATMTIANGAPALRESAWCVARSVSGPGAHLALYVVLPRLAMAIIVLEAVLAVTVILTALYAPDKYSNRAFTLLRWARRDGENYRAPRLFDQ